MFGSDLDQQNEVMVEAKKRAKAKMGFYLHSRLYIAALTLLTSVYLLTGWLNGGLLYFWLPWPVIVLTALLVCHYLAVFQWGEEGFRRMVAKEFYRGGATSVTLPAVYQAERRARIRIGFYWHITGAVIVNVLCLVSYVVTTLASGINIYPWFLWVILATGLSLFCHFQWIQLFSGQLSQQLLEQEISKLK